MKCTIELAAVREMKRPIPSVVVVVVVDEAWIVKEERVRVVEEGMMEYRAPPDLEEVQFVNVTLVMDREERG